MEIYEETMKKLGIKDGIFLCYDYQRLEKLKIELNKIYDNEVLKNAT